MIKIPPNPLSRLARFPASQPAIPPGLRSGEDAPFVPGFLQCLPAILSAAAILLLGLPPRGLAQDSIPPAAPKLKDEMRLPWTRSDEHFIRSWLVVGAFPGGLNDDGLAAEGGESVAAPIDGLEIKSADSKGAKWHPMGSWSDAINLDFPEAPKDGVIAYAFAKITRQQAGKALISLGSNGGMRVWLNGKPVLSREGKRTFVPDEDQIEADLNAGDNRLLVKILKPAESWVFSARVAETGTLLPRAAEIFPAIAGRDATGLTLRTDICRRGMAFARR